MVAAVRDDLAIAEPPRFVEPGEHGGDLFRRSPGEPSLGKRPRIAAPIGVDRFLNGGEQGAKFFRKLAGG